MKNYSQNNEQEILLNYLIKNNLIKGTLLDIGAFDGETYSNTRGIMLHFEDWKGVFVEPSSYSFYKLFSIYQNQPRRAELINILVVEELENNCNLIEFYDSPIAPAASSRDILNVHRFINNKNEQGDSIDPRKIFLGKTGLKNILKLSNTFEFINIDVEGGSATLALQSWFNPIEYNCKLLCIEHDSKEQELYNKFKQLGYNLIGHNAENLIFGI